MSNSMLLLDTDIVSFMGRRRGPPGLRPWLIKVGIERLGISYPVIAELMRGAHLKRNEDPVRAAEIEFWVKRILATAFPRPEMSLEVAVVYAKMTAVPPLRNMWTIQKNQRSSRLGHDLMIAAVAIAHRLPLMSANVDDYMRIHDYFPLPGLYHPLEAKWHVRPHFRVSLPRFDCADLDPARELLPVL